MECPLPTQSQITTTTTMFQQWRPPTAMGFPKGTLSLRRRPVQFQQVKQNHDHKMTMIIFYDGDDKQDDYIYDDKSIG